MTRLFLSVFICPVLMCRCSVLKSRSDPPALHFTGSTIINTGPRHCREPSGIVFSARRGALFVIDDEGTICELQLDGTLVNKKRIRKADLEGITLDPATGLSDNHDTLMLLTTDVTYVQATRFPGSSRRASPWMPTAICILQKTPVTLSNTYLMLLLNLNHQTTHPTTALHMRAELNGHTG
jgi:hypothetical protein